jgi:CHAD domain-containing protein
MDEQVILTYKGPNSGANGVREREEIERPLPADQADGSHYHQWPAEIVERIAPLVGDAQLQPLIKTYITRHIWSIERDGATVGEVALDQGVISAGGRTTRVHELEIELKGSGELSDLTALEALLLPALPLQPQPLGKVQRGLALLGRNRTLDGRTPLDVLCIHMVRKHLRKLHQSEPSVRADADPEGVHDMRVATRRLRTTLRFLEESNLFDNHRLHILRRGLRGLAAALGQARDLDVFIKRVETYREAHPDAGEDLDILMRTLHKRRHNARRALLKKLDGQRTQRLLADLESFTTETHPASERQPRMLTRHFAGSAIWQRYERVRGFETLGRNMPPATLHRLRITCKRLRYTLEFFAPELGKGTQPLLGALTRAQDHLGALQDTVVALATVNELAHESPTNTGLTDYCHALMDERNRLQSSFEPIWNDLCDPSFAQELAELIAGL